ncbi:unnamed protein product [Echinostoma caproni]|uniref:Uncharacterized protein n=1 Tax=Echinostoma caproni TaxID=27848 RepID=A0A183ATM2_9TREM|nr:unnamed protein product [Echinostoma caproni]
MVYHKLEKMNFNIVIFLLINYYVSGIVAENCEVVTATAEAKSFVIKNNITGCQYRVTSDSSKPLKVFVNATSGTDCVKVTSGDKSEMLCSTGAMTEFKSSSSIDVSADSVTTTTTTPPTTVTTTPTTAPPLPNPGEMGEKKDKEGTKSGTAGGPSKEESQRGGEREEETDEGKAESEDLQSQAGPAAVKQLIRQTRDTSRNAGSNEVTVYYMLGEC